MKNKHIIETNARKLRDLKSKYPNKIPKNLSGPAKGWFCGLKEAGSSNPQIFNLLGGAWSLSTIRQYTKGVKSTAPGIGDEEAELVKECIDSGRPTERIPEAIDLLKKFDSYKIQVDEVGQFLFLCKQHSIEPSSVVKSVSELQNMNIRLEELSRIIDYKSRLDKMGYNIGTLEKFKEIASTYNEKEVFTALAGFGTIKGIEVETKNALAKKQAVLSDVQTGEARVYTLKKQEVTIQSNLDLYQYLRSIGITDKLLEGAVRMVKKYGGPDNFFASLDKHDNFEQLRFKLSEIERKCQDAESRRLALEAKYAGLVNVVAMCDTLLNTFKFSVPMVERLYELVKTYREPSDVFTAVTSYRDISRVRATNKELKMTTTRLESELAEVKRQLAEAQGRLNATNNSLASILQELRANFIAGCEAVLKDMEGRCGEIVSFIAKNEEISYAKLAEIQKYDRWLPVMRMLWSMNIELGPNSDPRYLATYFLAAAHRVCTNNKISRAVDLGNMFGRRYPSIRYVPMETSDLIAMAAATLGIILNNGGAMA